MTVRRGLIVEDTASTRKLLAAILAREGVETEEASTVDGALHKLHSARFDIVMLDLGLGDGGSGYEVLRAIRRRPELSGLAVIVVSARGEEPMAMAKSYKVGADDIVVKPFQAESLQARIRAALARRSAEGGLGTVCCPARADVQNAAEIRALMSSPLPFRWGAAMVAGSTIARGDVRPNVLDVVTDRKERMTAITISPAYAGATGALVSAFALGAARSALRAGQDLDETLESIRFALGDLKDEVATGLVRSNRAGTRVEVLAHRLPAIIIADDAGARVLDLQDGKGKLVPLAPGGALALRGDGAERDADPVLLSALASPHRAALAKAAGGELAQLLRETRRKRDDGALLIVGRSLEPYAAEDYAHA